MELEPSLVTRVVTVFRILHYEFQSSTEFESPKELLREGLREAFRDALKETLEEPLNEVIPPHHFDLQCKILSSVKLINQTHHWKRAA